jgi:histidinol-phosphate phosphatase family protein
MRLAHLADLHLRLRQPGTSRSASRRSRVVATVLPQALAQVQAAGADLIVVTGDVLDVPDYLLGHHAGYDFGRELWEADAEADYRWLRAQLDATGLPYHVLPGNHDWCDPFQRVFGDQPRVFELGGYRYVAFWDREGDGHVPRRLDRERALLEQVLREPGPQVHLQHYLLHPPLDAGWPYNYLECEHLRAQVAGSGKVVLALAGHYHQGTDLLAWGGTQFAAAPAFTVCPHGWRLLALDGPDVSMATHATLAQPLEHGRPAVFLDRDGVLTVAPSWRAGPDTLATVPGAPQALRALHDAGYALVVISSQSAVGYGYVTPETVDACFDKLARDLLTAGVCYDAFYFSTGAGEHAVHERWRDQSDAKPSPAHVLAACRTLGLSLAGSVFVGDNLSDLQCALNAGVTPILVRTGAGAATEQRLASHPELGPVPVLDSIRALTPAWLQNYNRPARDCAPGDDQ